MHVLIASVHRLFAEVVAEALRVTAPDVDVHVAGDADEVVTLLERVRPTTVLVDEDLLAELGEVGAAIEGLRTVLLTGASEEGAVMTARRLGFNGVVGRDARLAEVRDVLLSECDDLVVVGLGSTEARRDRGGAAPAHGLTPRELEVLRLLTLGADNATISRSLEITPNTVRTHVQNVFTKLGVSSRLAAATQAIHAGIVPLQLPPEADTSLVTPPRRG